MLGTEKISKLHFIAFSQYYFVGRVIVSPQRGLASSSEPPSELTQQVSVLQETSTRFDNSEVIHVDDRITQTSSIVDANRSNTCLARNGYGV